MTRLPYNIQERVIASVMSKILISIYNNSHGFFGRIIFLSRFDSEVSEF